MRKLSSKLIEFTGEPTFWCPGCKDLHIVNVHKENPRTGAVWGWDRNVDKPTFHPSLLISLPDNRRCHLYVREGRLQFLMDSSHSLAGEVVEMPDIPDEELEFCGL